MRSRLRPLSDHDGATAVEFAIVAPLLFMLIFGIIQFGIFFAQDLAISNAARQAARTAAVSTTGNCGDIFDEAYQGAVTVALDLDNPNFDISVYAPEPPDPPGFNPADLCPGGFPGRTPNNPGFEPCAGQPPGSNVTVTIDAAARIAIPFVGDGLVDIQGEGVYRCEFS